MAMHKKFKLLKGGFRTWWAEFRKKVAFWGWLKGSSVAARRLDHLESGVNFKKDTALLAHRDLVTCVEDLVPKAAIVTPSSSCTYLF